MFVMRVLCLGGHVSTGWCGSIGAENVLVLVYRVVGGEGQGSLKYFLSPTRIFQNQIGCERV